MADKYQIIARYTEGIPKYWIGQKIDPNRPLDDDNVRWKTHADGTIIKYSQYADAKAAVDK